MELEHVKVGSGNLKENPDAKCDDGTPRINQDIPSPYSSGTEFDISEQGSLHKSSTQSQYDGDLSPYPPPIPSLATTQIPQTGTLSSPPEAKSELQNSPPQPSAVSMGSSSRISPPIQVTGNPLGYDPNHIPKSGLSSNRSNTSEWSATSNESLFSIQGNNSFSRDYANLFLNSGELSKHEDWNGSQSNLFGLSGDFPRLEEQSNTAQSNPQSASEAKSNDLSNLPPVMEVPSNEESTVLSDEHPRTGCKDGNKCPVLASQAPLEYHANENPILSPTHVEDHTKENLIPAHAVDPPVASPKRSDVENALPAVTTPRTPSSPATFASPSRFSNESGNSCHSFAFPVLVNDNAKGNNASLKVIQEGKPEVPQPEVVLPTAQPQSRQLSQNKKETPKAASQTRRCWCFPCLPRWC